MIKIKLLDENYKKKINSLYSRPSYPEAIENNVKEIIQDVAINGNKAIVKYAKKFDFVSLDKTQLLVTEQEIKNAESILSQDDKVAICAALKNIRAFSEYKKPQNWNIQPREGVSVGERYTPMDRIGVYIPGGTAPLVSTVLHTAGIAQVAGVKEIVAVTPPQKDGSVHPAILYALSQAGATEIYRIGGVYGIAAMAYGTESIDKVEKIVGPGNAYITAAKKLVFGKVSIDMVAGPSEIMILADETANPAYIAADMLSQAEHGSGLEQAVLVTNNLELIDKVQIEIKLQTKKLNRSEPIEKVTQNGMFFIEVRNMDEAAQIATNYAPEHLEIMCKEAAQVAEKVKSAGAIFIGEWTPEPVGDFVAGPSHVLPTASSAKFFNGLSVSDFFKRTSIVHYKKEALEKELPFIQRIADMEGLDAHKNSVAIRFQK